MTVFIGITHRLTFLSEKEVYYGFTNDSSRLMNKAII